MTVIKPSHRPVGRAQRGGQPDPLTGRIERSRSTFQRSSTLNLLRYHVIKLDAPPAIIYRSHRVIAYRNDSS
jgi:hypothetical protein